MVLKDDRQRDRMLPGGPDRAYKAMGWIGLGFLVVGCLDFGLVWVPPQFGNLEWRFSAAAQGLGTLPVPTLGLALMTVAGFHARRRWWPVLAGVASVLLGLAVLGTVGMWAPSVAVVLDTVPPDQRMGLYRSLGRMAIQSLAYPLMFGYLAWMGLRYGPWIPPR